MLQIESPERFWIQSPLRNAEIALKQLNVVLNAPEHMNVLIKLPANSDLSMDSLYVAKPGNSRIIGQSTDEFYRCQIVGKRVQKDDHTRYVYAVRMSRI